MTSALDMALDDLVKSNKQSAGAGKNKGGGRRNGVRRTGSGPIRRNTARPRPSPYFTQASSRAPEGQWEHDLFEEGAYAAPLKPNMGIETGTKLFISNLDFGVSNEDIKELFSEIGDLKRSTVHFDRSGRSNGTAEVVYSRRADAQAAVKRYNNVQLDGKPMKIEIIGTNLTIPAMPTQNPKVASNGKRGQGKKDLSSQGAGGPSRRGRGGRGKVKSAADLDAELDDYHAGAMQVS